MGQHGILANEFHLLASEDIAFTPGLAFFTFICRHFVPIRHRPSVERHKVECLLLLAQPDLIPRRTMTYDCVGISRDKPLCLHRIARGNELRVVVGMSTQVDVAVAITFGQPAPTSQALLLRFLFALVGVRHVQLLRLAPHTYIGLLCRYPVCKALVVVGLAVPHAVLYVPIKQAQGSVILFSSMTRHGSNKKHDKEKQSQFHSTTYYKVNDSGNNFASLQVFTNDGIGLLP